MKIKSFRDLNIWKLSKDLVTEVYKLTRDFPKEERFDIISQMRRSAVSIPSNIAEGFNRFHNKEYRQFLFLALGSCAELETQIEINHDLEYIRQTNKNTILETIDHESRMIRSLIKKL